MSIKGSPGGYMKRKFHHGGKMEESNSKYPLSNMVDGETDKDKISHVFVDEIAWFMAYTLTVAETGSKLWEDWGIPLYLIEGIQQFKLFAGNKLTIESLVWVFSDLVYIFISLGTKWLFSITASLYLTMYFWNNLYLFDPVLD